MLERTRSKDKISVMRAKPGYVLVTEYIKSDKRMDIHLERINY